MNLLHIIKRFRAVAWPLLWFSAAAAATPVPTFIEEFDGTELALNRWSPHRAGEPVGAAGVPLVSGGELHLRAGQAVTTFGLYSQAYGRVEIRWRFSGSGISPRFRLVSAHTSAIDLAGPSDTAGKLWMGNTWGDARTDRSFGDAVEIAPGSHTVTVEWSAGSIVWKLDGKEKLRATEGVPAEPLYLELGATGTGNGVIDVDFVRAYRQEGLN